MVAALRRGADAVLFIGTTVAVAKATQYAAVDQLGASLGFATASLIGVVPIVFCAALIKRRLDLRKRLRDDQGQSIR
ncbi:hypothetical protein [Sphingomonas sp. Mn802worker]|uniref:hypothetical protein n=1 Tax=Sphingomonas sp. Mn802worker TaxID=629773 RepID=UPI0012EA65B8|nr:hypothetical protein [Sphingomonas sp. Mn802worker]